VSQRPRLGAHQQPPLPLIQMREDRRELRRQDLNCFLAALTTSASAFQEATLYFSATSKLAV
jgi:hypothetical protein